MGKIPEYCYNMGCYSRKYWCAKRLAGSGCCYNNPGVTPKTWDDCPFGKLHKHYKVDVAAEKAKLDKARKISREITEWAKYSRVQPY